jgi:diguanylate cyclase (GGDEF)-like protein
VPIRDHAGQIIGFQGVTRDISVQKRHRTEQQQANAQLALQLQQIQDLQVRLQEQAIRDALTGLYNRRYLDETLPRELSRARREGYPLAVIMVDIDHFKKINDAHGHPAGDDVIRSLGSILRQGEREGDMACRYGGEEFVVVLPHMAIDAAAARAERWRQDVEAQRVEHAGVEMRFTISAGIAVFPAHTDSTEGLIECADLALYQSKSMGRNRITCFAPAPKVSPH